MRVDKIMKNLFIVFGVILTVIVHSAFCVAGDCSKIDITLRFALNNEFPLYDVVLSDTLSEKGQQKSTSLGKGACSNIAEIAPSVYVLVLKKKTSDEYLVVQASLSAHATLSDWMIEKVDVFQNDIPALQKARGGFYSDVVTDKKLTVARGSYAVHVSCLESGNQFIYKTLAGGAFEKCRVK